MVPHVLCRELEPLRGSRGIFISAPARFALAREGEVTVTVCVGRWTTRTSSGHR